MNKALDRAPHIRISPILSAYESDAFLMKLFSSCLLTGQRVVSIELSVSQLLLVTVVVVQGCVLGLLLFPMYVKGVSHIETVEHCLCSLTAKTYLFILSNRSEKY